MTHKKFSQSGSVDESLRLLKYRVVQSKTDELDIVKAWNGFLATSRAEGHALKQGAIKNGEKQTALGYYKCQKLHVFYNYTVQRNTLYGQAPRQLQQKKKSKTPWLDGDPSKEHAAKTPAATASRARTELGEIKHGPRMELNLWLSLLQVEGSNILLSFFPAPHTSPREHAPSHRSLQDCCYQP